MTREQALGIAKQKRLLMNAELFKVWGNVYPAAQYATEREAAAAVEAKYGYKHGWWTVGGYMFNDEDLVGYMPTYDA